MCIGKYACISPKNKIQKWFETNLKRSVIDSKF